MELIQKLEFPHHFASISELLMVGLEVIQSRRKLRKVRALTYLGTYTLGIGRYLPNVHTECSLSIISGPDLKC
jgi:hypothetical protein